MGPSRIAGALLAAAALVASIWLLEALDFLTGHALDYYGVTPRRTGELADVFFAPFLHAGFVHVMANSVPLAVLGFLTALRGLARLALVTLIVIIIGGFGVWLTAPPNTITLGASIIVFGYFGYLVSRGIIDRRPIDIVIAVVVLLLYWTMIFGVLPSQSGVSWQGHLFGLIGGIVAAWVLRRGGAASWPAARGGGYGYRP